MGEKWNERCGCNCPKAAHITVLNGSWRDGYTDWKCTATIHDDDISWPCRCSFMEKSMATGIACETCGSIAPLTEKLWVKDLLDAGLDTKLTAAVKESCRYLEGVNHEPIDASVFM